MGRGTDSEVEARKNGEVFRKAEADAARESSQGYLRCMADERGRQ